MENTAPSANPRTISKTGCWSLLQTSLNLLSRCQTLEREITLQDSCCDAVQLLFPTMGKLKPQNPAEISSTNSAFVSKSYATKRWLRLVGRVKKLGSPANLVSCLNEVEGLIRIFVASIRTTEKNTK